LEEKAMKTERAAPEGFTLVELMIAMAVIAIGITALLSVINVSTKMHLGSEQGITAKNAARALVETLKGYSCDQISLMYYPEANVSVSGFSSSDQATGTIAVDKTDPALLKVAVRVKWRIGVVNGQNKYCTYEVRRLFSNQDNQ
jgi:prepilin-type N-terminal cleavage/methylation domain-containing protein